MLTEQPNTSQLIDLQNLHGESAHSCLPKRNVSWLVSLLHYFAFGVDTYVLLTIAEQSAVQNAQSLADATPNSVESINLKLSKHLVVLEHDQFELVSLSN